MKNVPKSAKSGKFWYIFDKVNNMVTFSVSIVLLQILVCP